MKKFIAQRIVFKNGERLSLLTGTDGLPVHEVTLYLETFRNNGRAANTIHFACQCLSLLYRELYLARIDLLERLQQGEFLTSPELGRLNSAARYRQDDLEEDVLGDRKNVISLRRIGMRHRKQNVERQAINAHMYASRLRYIANYLEYISNYIAATLPRSKRTELVADATYTLKAFRAEIPKISKRNQLDSRIGLSVEEQDRLVAIVHPDSPDNPWVHGFVRRRNWLIVVLLLASGMRRGELLGLQIGDLHPGQPKLKILRRADSADDKRINQPNTKTYDREIELATAVMRVLQHYLKERRHIKAARSIPQVIVSEDGNALSMQSVDKLFKELRAAIPGLPVRLTSHVLRHTWNERFSEQADSMNLSEVAEQRARNNQQGWSENSKMAATYTRRYTERKGRELVLKLQEKMDEKLRIAE